LTRDDDYTVLVREKLEEVAQAYELDGAANAAIAFVARHPANSVIVIGSGKQNRIEGAIIAVNTELDRADWYDIVAQTHRRLFF
jgi:predicted oxidoreductase